MIQLDTPSRLRDEVQSTEDCLCQMSEPTGEWVKVAAAIDSATVDVVIPKDFVPNTKTREKVRTTLRWSEHHSHQELTSIRTDSKKEQRAEKLTQAGGQLEHKQGSQQARAGEVTPLRRRGSLRHGHVVLEDSTRGGFHEAGCLKPRPGRRGALVSNFARDEQNPEDPRKRKIETEMKLSRWKVSTVM